jgi:hypothetical protein
LLLAAVVELITLLAGLVLEALEQPQGLRYLLVLH